MWRDLGASYYEYYYYDAKEKNGELYRQCKMCSKTITSYPMPLLDHLIREHSFESYWTPKSGHSIGYKTRVLR